MMAYSVSQYSWLVLASCNVFCSVELGGKEADEDEKLPVQPEDKLTASEARDEMSARKHNLHYSYYCAIMQVHHIVIIILLDVCWLLLFHPFHLLHIYIPVYVKKMQFSWPTFQLHSQSHTRMPNIYVKNVIKISLTVLSGKF